MAIDVTMPKLSDTMEEGKIIKWMKHVGDPVRPGDVLAEVETDKANMELEAYDEGVLADVRVGEGESAAVGAVIAVLEGAEAARPAGEKAPTTEERRPAQPAARTATGPRPLPVRPATVQREAESRRAPAVRRTDGTSATAGDGSASVKASPLARRIAAEHGLDLAGVTGTGPGGRIVEKDVEEALARGGAASGERPKRAPDVAPATGPAGKAPAAGGRVELSRIRRTTAKRMAEAKRDVPHFYASAEIAMDEAKRLKDGLAALGGAYEGLTYTHLVLKAVGLALRRVPELNASYDGDAIALHDTVHVGLATATDDGLMVPVVHDCDRAPLAVIVRQARAVVDRTRRGRLAGDDLSGATFTVSNLGMFPVTDFAAVINPPQAAILAVGTVRAAALVRDGHLVPGHVATFTLSSDHRIVDGVLAGRFLGEVKNLLEQPLALIA